MLQQEFVEREGAVRSTVGIEVDALTGRPIYLAGQRVMPGRYRQLETGREVVLEHEDRLPASLDGRIACYIWLGPSSAPRLPQEPAPPNRHHPVHELSVL
ncbi:hypothetical protein CTKA_02508 [Chthonomonas calidirosea]|uniref:Uncharacterized protein n=1 Tax=Chthonomonas calidirosea (strain DSM 23976 / ICMP 18418 / T49) TaxID=1303518 RepID=S0EYI3_CHTCT|nr:hypothetical protein [Chthonomonas calidirosea]CCW35408.1 hypothetical protein CCALI_01592 [Chthonomonas calidirosea T49]CEK20363.1 hypothetical protein CTKA_02508 [Chthonomonas calidirosea]